jgi:hypothetical protein
MGVELSPFSAHDGRYSNNRINNIGKTALLFMTNPPFNSLHVIRYQIEKKNPLEG